MARRVTRRLAALLLIAPFLAAASPARAAEPAAKPLKPNIVVILADDK